MIHPSSMIYRLIIHPFIQPWFFHLSIIHPSLIHPSSSSMMHPSTHLQSIIQPSIIHQSSIHQSIYYPHIPHHLPSIPPIIHPAPCSVPARVPCPPWQHPRLLQTRDYRRRRRPSEHRGLCRETSGWASTGRERPERERKRGSERAWKERREDWQWKSQSWEASQGSIPPDKLSNYQRRLAHRAWKPAAPPVTTNNIKEHQAASRLGLRLKFWCRLVVQYNDIDEIFGFYLVPGHRSRKFPHPVSPLLLNMNKDKWSQQFGNKKTKETLNKNPSGCVRSGAKTFMRKIYARLRKKLKRKKEGKKEEIRKFYKADKFGWRTNDITVQSLRDNLIGRLD